MSSPRTLTALLVVQRAVLSRPTSSTLQAVGAQSFYDNFRNAAVHEFSLKPGFAIGRDSGMRGIYANVQQIHGVPGKTLVLNIDLLAKEFLAHLDSLLANLEKPAPDHDPDMTAEEKARIARLSQYVLSEEAWFRAANELVAAMDLLEPRIKNFWECLGVGAGVVDRKNSEAEPEHSLINVHMMLAGLAIENLCKGHLAGRLNPKEKEDIKARGILPKSLKNHEILDLLARTKMKLSDIEKDLVERIGKAIWWRGRYPSPTSHEEIVPFVQKDSDVDKIKTLLQKLRAHVGAKDSYRLLDPNVLRTWPPS